MSHIHIARMTTFKKKWKTAKIMKILERLKQRGYKNSHDRKN